MNGSGRDLYLNSDKDKNCEMYIELMNKYYEELLPKSENYQKINTNKDISYIAKKILDITKEKLNKKFE